MAELTTDVYADGFWDDHGPGPNRAGPTFCAVFDGCDLRKLPRPPEANSKCIYYIADENGAAAAGFLIDPHGSRVEVEAGGCLVVEYPPPHGGIQFRRADELLSERQAEPDWVWQGALVRGAVTLFVGRPKAGKSTLLYALAAAVAGGSKLFLGRLLKGGPVVYASEESRSTLEITFPRTPHIHLLTRDTAWPKPTWENLVAAAADRVRAVGATLCVIDTFSFWNGLGQDGEKDAGAVQPLLDALTEITSVGCPVALSHHHRKAPGEDGTAIRGSSAIAGVVDAFVECETIRDAPTNQRQVVVTSRWPSPPVLVVEWTLAGGYRVVGEAASREDAAEQSWPQRILDALPADGDGSTQSELADLLDGAHRNKWGGALKRLVAQGQVERTGRGVANAPYRYRATTGKSVTEVCSGVVTDRNGESPCESVPRYRAGTDSQTLQTSDSVPVLAPEQTLLLDGLGRCRRCRSTFCTGCGEATP